MNDPNSDKCKASDVTALNGLTERKGNDVTITYTGNRATLAHELSHGYDQLTGESDGSGRLDDMYDEQRAFRRAYAYDDTYHGFANYSAITTNWVMSNPYYATNPPPPSKTLPKCPVNGTFFIALAF